jgi:8-oxo-dGTP diphosphatase
VLLLRHPPDDDRFAGLWNGIGGHVEPGEDIREAARRELREEVGLEVRELRLRGVIHETGLLGHAYVVFLFVGQSPTRRLRPAQGLEAAWQRIDQLGELSLVEDLVVLLPRLLTAREPLFVTEAYDGRDRRLALRLSGESREAATLDGEGERARG